jgi:hypothetical protein
MPRRHMGLLDIGGSLGTVPRQESMPNNRMPQCGIGNFKMALLICLIFSALPTP